MLTLHFSNQVDFRRAAPFRALLRKAQKVLPPIPEKEVELALVDDPTIRRLNHQMRGLDKPTDVLSFANREIDDPATRKAASHSLGEIVISVPAAQRNADEIGQSLEEELRFLFLHGLLHILGYDHQTPKEEAKMMGIAYEILGCPPFKPN
jgi:probable rRNA maturation factor